MKNKFIWLGLSFLLVAAMLLASCATSSASTSTSTTTTTTTPTTTTQTTTAAITTTPTTTTATGNWWDSLGTPQYGGTMTLRIPKDIVNFDPYYSELLFNIQAGWMERLYMDEWTLDPAVFGYEFNFRPNDYEVGCLAERWEFTDPSTYVVHVRQGVYWQNIPPANGREFTASDVAFHYDREYGLGGGFTKPSPYLFTAASWASCQSVTATDTYTVVFKWKVANPEFILETMQLTGDIGCIENPEAVQEWGNLNDWHHAIGTGPFILHDFVSGSSATLVKNPDYWGYDERYPQNKLPYVDSVVFIEIPDAATALAAVRSGKVDYYDSASLMQAQQIQKTNPDIVQWPVPLGQTTTVDPRIDVVPFKDIRVREAMQMAIDLPAIAKTFYAGTTEPYPSTLASNYMPGWGFPYTQWPQDLKDQYAYNPTAAKKLLADAGYPNGFNTDIVADTASDLDLLQVVKSYFAAIGINMDIRTMDTASLSAFVTARKEDQMYYKALGGGTLGALAAPYTVITHYQTGNSANYTNISDPAYDAFCAEMLAATSVDEAKKIFSDANEYVAQQHYTISLLQPNLFNLAQPWLKGYAGQANALYGSTGPALLYEYAARTWIDQNLKK